MLFEWSDHSHVTFTQWQTGEPSHTTNFQEDCVLIRGKVRHITLKTQKANKNFNDHSEGTILIMCIFPIQDGSWADHMCEKTYGYICKKKASIKQAEGTQEEANPGCKQVSDVIPFKCNFIYV